MKNQVLIAGAGLAGLSAAYHLRKPYLLLEKEPEPGGKARSRRTSGGSIFDFTGHLLHLRRPEMIALVEKLLPDAFQRIERKAAVFMENTFLPYPFQANFHPLSRQTVKDCLLGFIQAWKEGKQDPERFSSFADWAMATFGDGICRHFLYPYNEKLYRTPPAEMSAEWVSWSVPQPELEAVIDGALGTVQEGLGYNASFLYPREGGIDLLPNALAGQLEAIEYQTELTAIDAARRTAIDAGGNEYPFSSLVSTMPLPRLVEITKGLSPDLKGAAKELRYVNVYNINLVVRRKPEWNWQWLYLPEPGFRCYRIGVSSNISEHLAAGDAATVYAEVSYLPHQQPDHDELLAGVKQDLKRLGIIGSDGGILETLTINLDCAYVVHNQHRARWLPRILKALEELNIISTGRWGQWVYGGMEDALWQGYQTARLLNSR